MTVSSLSLTLTLTLTSIIAMQRSSFLRAARSSCFDLFSNIIGPVIPGHFVTLSADTTSGSLGGKAVSGPGLLSVVRRAMTFTLPRSLFVTIISSATLSPYLQKTYSLKNCSDMYETRAMKTAMQMHRTPQKIMRVEVLLGRNGRIVLKGEL